VFGDGIVFCDGIVFGDSTLAGDAVTQAQSAATNGDQTAAMPFAADDGLDNVDY